MKSFQKNILAKKGFYFTILNESRPGTAVIYIEADEDAMVARLLERGKTSGRADDNAETIKQRLRVFSEQTKPVVDHFSAKLTKVNGLQTIDEVFGDVDAVMKKL